MREKFLSAREAFAHSQTSFHNFMRTGQRMGMEQNFERAYNKKVLCFLLSTNFHSSEVMKSDDFFLRVDALPV